MHNIKVIVLVITIMLSTVAQSEESNSTHVKTVEQFIAAFNAQNSNAMAELVSNDIEWLSVNGDQVLVEVKGKVVLIESMNDYFQSCPSCKSTILSIASTRSRVSAVELASWQAKDGSKSQRAISIYEFSNGLISRVYYFPAEQ